MAAAVTITRVCEGRNLTYSMFAAKSPPNHKDFLLLSQSLMNLVFATSWPDPGEIAILEAMPKPHGLLDFTGTEQDKVQERTPSSVDTSHLEQLVSTNAAAKWIIARQEYKKLIKQCRRLGKNAPAYAHPRSNYVILSGVAAAYGLWTYRTTNRKPVVALNATDWQSATDAVRTLRRLERRGAGFGLALQAPGSYLPHDWLDRLGAWCSRAARVRPYNDEKATSREAIQNFARHLWTHFDHSVSAAMLESFGGMIDYQPTTIRSKYLPLWETQFQNERAG